MSLTARPTPAGRMAKWAPGISAPFGYSQGYRGGKYPHHGQDYFWLTTASAGSAAASAASFRVYAAGSGTVTKTVWTFELGYCITIDHGPFQTRYCHMPNNSAAVTVGQKVTDQTYLGPMGNAGTDAFGEYHLHFEVWQNATRVDPAPYFATTAGGTGTEITPTVQEFAMAQYAFTPEGGGYIITEDGALTMTAFEWASEQKLISVQGAPDGAVRLALNELATISELRKRVSRAAAPVSVSQVDAIVAGVVAAIPAQDPTVIGQAVRDAVAASVPSAAVIAKTVNDDAAARLAQ